MFWGIIKIKWRKKASGAADEKWLWIIRSALFHLTSHFMETDWTYYNTSACDFISKTLLWLYNFVLFNGLTLNRLRVSVLALALQCGHGGLLHPQHGVIETVFVDHGGHALNTEVSLQQTAELQHICCRGPVQTRAPSLSLVPLRRVSSLGLLLCKVEPLQLGLQLAGQGAEPGPLPCSSSGGAEAVAGQQGLWAGITQEAVGSVGVLRPTRTCPLGVRATALLPPPPRAAPLGRWQLGPPQGAGGGSISDEGAQSSQDAGLGLQTAETQTAQRFRAETLHYWLSLSFNSTTKTIRS